MNNKGFMMAEVIVVSAIILTLLTTLFISYNKIYSAYNKRISYYDNTTLYRLAYYRDILIENELLNNLLTETKNAPTKTTTIYNTDNADDSLFKLPDSEYSENKDYDERVYITYIGNNEKKIKIENVQAQIIKPTFTDYLNFLSDAVKLESNYVLLMERCYELSDKDDCKYAYLELYDGKES